MRDVYSSWKYNKDGILWCVYTECVCVCVHRSTSSIRVLQQTETYKNRKEQREKNMKKYERGMEMYARNEGERKKKRTEPTSSRWRHAYKTQRQPPNKSITYRIKMFETKSEREGERGILRGFYIHWFISLIFNVVIVIILHGAHRALCMHPQWTALHTILFTFTNVHISKSFYIRIARIFHRFFPFHFISFYFALEHWKMFVLKFFNDQFFSRNTFSFSVVCKQQERKSVFSAFVMLPPTIPTVSLMFICI